MEDTYIPIEIFTEQCVDQLPGPEQDGAVEQDCARLLLDAAGDMRDVILTPAPTDNENDRTCCFHGGQCVVM